MLPVHCGACRTVHFCFPHSLAADHRGGQQGPHHLVEPVLAPLFSAVTLKPSVYLSVTLPFHRPKCNGSGGSPSPGVVGQLVPTVYSEITTTSLLMIPRLGALGTLSPGAGLVGGCVGSGSLKMS